MDHERTPADRRDGDDVRATLEGDLDAYGRIVERYQEVAFRAAWLVVRDAPAAQDVCQEAFLRAHRHLDRFRAGDPLRPWLLRIVTNLAKNHVRARGRREGVLTRLWRVRRSPADPPERAVLVAEERQEVIEAMAQLSPDDREAIQLRYFLDLSEAEMATVLDVRPGTVKSRLSRARARLRAVIEAEHPDLVRTPVTSEERDA